MTELNAIMCVWNEADIIEASVRHAFAQGCRHVFLVDNGSTDDTVVRAQAAGAEIALRFESKYFDEIQKIAFLNHVVRQYNERHNDSAIWWLYLDADEFPDAGSTLTLAGLVNSLDDTVQALHGMMFNHFPSHLPYYVQGFHPADFMPLASITTTEKIPLVRYNRDKPHLYSCGGAHTLDTNGESILLVRNAIRIHHFQFRRPEHSRARLKKLLAKREDGTRRVDWMDNYAGKSTKGDKMQSAYHGRLQKSMETYKVDWPTLLTSSPVYNFATLKRWYDAEQIVLDEDLDTRDKLLFQAVYNKFLGHADKALFAFNDLLPLCDNRTSVYVYANIAACLMADNPDEAKTLLLPILKHEDTKLKNYATRLLASMISGQEPDTAHNPGKNYRVERYSSTLDTATMQACMTLEQAIDNMASQNGTIQFL